MGQRALVIVVVLVLGVGLFAYFGYSSYDARRAGLDGDVFSSDSSLRKAKAEAVSPAVASSAGQTVVYPSGPAQTVPVTPEALRNSGETRQDGTPVGDSIGPNPPNGMVFSGKGKYQLYRQGDLTWRLNTETGQTCIIFATDEEWKKWKVYRAGCAGR
jgi:hypothetical protein